MADDTQDTPREADERPAERANVVRQRLVVSTNVSRTEQARRGGSLQGSEPPPESAPKPVPNIKQRIELKQMRPRRPGQEKPRRPANMSDIKI